MPEIPKDVLMLLHSMNKTQTQFKVKNIKVGSRVQAFYKDKKVSFNGVVSKVNSDSTFNIEYDDGDKEENVAAHLLEALPPLKEKSRVLALYKVR